MPFDRIMTGTSGEDLLDDLQLGGSSFIRGLAGNDTIVSAGALNRPSGGDGDDEILVVGGLVLDGAGEDFIEAEVAARLTVNNGWRR